MSDTNDIEKDLKDSKHEKHEKHRIALGIEYEGTHYHGWQMQGHGAISVQEALEKALSKIANQKITLIGSGRTDAGVHALGQVAHFDTLTSRPPEAWVWGTNTLLPRDIRVQWVKLVPHNFNARGSAIARSYRYVIYTDRISPGLHRNGVTWIYDNLDIDKMSEAAKCFIGEHDFSSFRAKGCQAKTPHRRITRMDVKKSGSCIFIEVTGNAFLHHMVRNMAGVLIEIGRSRKPISWASDVLLAKERAKGGITAPASGLYLMSIDYPASFDLPPSGREAWFFE